MPYSTYHTTASEALRSAQEARTDGGRVEVVRWYEKSIDPHYMPKLLGWVVGVDQDWGNDQSADAEIEARLSSS